MTESVQNPPAPEYPTSQELAPAQPHQVVPAGWAPAAGTSAAMSPGITFAGQGSTNYRVNVGGVEQGPYPVEHVRAMARAGQLAPTDAVSYAGQPWVPATSAPGIFSDKSYVAALLISFFLGALGIDRFYLGYIGLGVAKLFLGWLTLGIWPLVDFILIAVRKVPDVHGRPLR